MRSTSLALCLVLGSASAVAVTGPDTLMTVRAIHALNNAAAAQAIPVSFEATITYIRAFDGAMFVQDDGIAIFVRPPTDAAFVPGDRVRVKGVTHESFRPFIINTTLTLVRHGFLPRALPTNWDELIRGQRDCQLVSVRGVIRAVNLVENSKASSRRVSSLQLLTEGGVIEATVDSDDANLNDLLDANVEVTGTVSGVFDGKMQQTGVWIHVATFQDVKVLRRATLSPWSLPETSMNEVLSDFHVHDLSRRVRVRGTITHYEPGSAIVLQNGAKSLLIETQTFAPLSVGDLADATGFPEVRNGALTLTNGEAQDRHVRAPVIPQPVTLSQLSITGNEFRNHNFELVSIEGRVVTEVRQAFQDEYVLVSDNQLFSAIYRHPVTIGPTQPPPLRAIPPGSRVRLSGICIPDKANPLGSQAYGQQALFNILLRSPSDIAVIAKPSPLTVRNLTILVSGLLLSVFAACGWAWTLRRRVKKQTTALAARIEAEALLERRRSRILEDINGQQPLAQTVAKITDLVSFSLGGAPCWCEMADGAQPGKSLPAAGRFRVLRQEIRAGAGTVYGTILVGVDADEQPSSNASEALSMGAWLATLAIDTRGLYSDLMHRSDFDLLTDIHNRFSFERRLNELIGTTPPLEIFGLIYIDLDDFKQVNDRFGHQVGDLYLREVAQRMKRQLRPLDLLARIGGDEFAVLVPTVRSRADVEEIALRLERCVDDTFSADTNEWHGSASLGVAIFSEDGTDKDSLCTAADATMYVSKHMKKQVRPKAREFVDDKSNAL